MSEEKFWKTTPRKLNALLKIHMEVQGSEGGSSDNRVKPGFIDQEM
jgi:hypothetical protein